MAFKKKSNEEPIVVQEIEDIEVMFNVLGTSPLIMNRFQQKAWQELLFPSERKNRAERAQHMKHIPLEEYRGAVYRNRDPKTASLIHVPPGAFHGALASAALDIPGATKAKMERLTRIADVQINLFGIPQLFMAMVRNSDANHTPDVRTRPIFPEWACQVKFRYIRSLLTERTVAALFGGAGSIVGIGDWRPQKGGSFGTWRLVDDTDTDFKRIVAKQGRVAQVAALEKPACYDLDSEELLAWFNEEVIRRERQDKVDPKASAKRGKASEAAVIAKLNGKGKIVNEDARGNLRR